MNKKLFYILSFIFIFISGCALHFAYDFFGRSGTVAVFAPVNESTWEHLKLLFWPFTVFAAVDYYLYGKNEKCLISANTLSVVCALFFIIVFFYTYSGILGFNLLLIDIFDFALADALALYLSYKLTESEDCPADEFSMIIIYTLVALCFFMWTFFPPDLGLFWA